MSSAETAVNVFRALETRDFTVLQAIEAQMVKHEFAPIEAIAKHARLNIEETEFRLNKLGKMQLIRREQGAYIGYALNYAGYDCLAINVLVKKGALEAFGKPLGVGKESDVYDGLNPAGERIAIKLHRLGRISFRQTTRKRSYTTEHLSWLLQSRKAAEKEFQALRLLFPKKVAVPKPISQNRHVIVMGMIEGAELADWRQIPQPKKILREILRNVRAAYLKAGVIHADLSEYNILLKPDTHILIIDWPQHVTTTHPNAQELLTRDVSNVLQYFRRRRILNVKLENAVAYVSGKDKTVVF